MGEKLKRFGDSLKNSLKNIGASAEKVLNSPALKKIDEDLKKISNEY